jgi:hypothetical protein
MPMSMSRPSSSFSSSRASSFSSSKSSSSSFKSSSSSSKSISSKPSSSSKSYKSGTKTYKLKKTEAKTVKPPVHSAPSHQSNVQHHYHDSSWSWMPFFFLEDWLDEDETVIVQDGKVVNQPQDDGFTGAEAVSIFLSLAVIAVVIFGIWRIRKW